MGISLANTWLPWVTIQETLEIDLSVLDSMATNESTKALRVPVQRLAHAHRAAGLLRPAQRTLCRPQDQLRWARTHPPEVESTPGSIH